MSKTPVDRRTLRTRRQLKQALIGMLQTRSLQQVSVQELTNLADISRGTFYLHYRDLFDLYQAIENDTVEGIAQIVAAPAPVDNEDSLKQMINAIFAHLVDNFDTYEALLKTDSTAFLERVFDRNRPNSEETWNTLYGDDNETRSFSYIFMCYGIAGMLRHWMDTGRKQSPQQVAAICEGLMRGHLIIKPGPKLPQAGGTSEGQ